jgi:hypothetical protein
MTNAQIYLKGRQECQTPDISGYPGQNNLHLVGHIGQDEEVG